MYMYINKYIYICMCIYMYIDNYIILYTIYVCLCVYSLWQLLASMFKHTHISYIYISYIYISYIYISYIYILSLVVSVLYHHYIYIPMKWFVYPNLLDVSWSNPSSQGSNRPCQRSSSCYGSGPRGLASSPGRRPPAIVTSQKKRKGWFILPI
jgi:hypothetical protein